MSNSQAFYHSLFRTVIPLMVQSFLTSSINFIDQLMVSSLGTEAVAAVGAGAKVFWVIQLFIYGTCSGSAMFLAQFWGKQDHKNLKKIFGICLTLTSGMGVLVFFAVLFLPHTLMGCFTDDPMVLEYGVVYLQNMCLNSVLCGISFSICYLLRSMSKVIIISISTAVSVVMSVLANYALIFGKFGFPALGIQGAAIGTVLTRTVEILVLVVYLFASKNVVTHRIGEIFSFDVTLIKTFLLRALPLICNETLWGLGTTLYFVVYGKIGTAELAAMSIVQTIQVLSQTFSLSFGNSSAIIVGNEIGREDYSKVWDYSKRYQKLSVVLGLCTTAIVLLAIGPVLAIYGIDGTLEGSYVQNCMIVLAISSVFYAFNILHIEGLFRSGGDSRYIVRTDMGSIWFIGLPFTVITGLLLHWNIAVVFSAFILVELFKLPQNIYRFHSKKWIHNLTQVDLPKRQSVTAVSKT